MLACLESFKFCMINLTHEVIQILKEFFCLNMFDEQGNPNLIFLSSDLLSIWFKFFFFFFFFAILYSFGCKLRSIQA